MCARMLQLEGLFPADMPETDWLNLPLLWERGSGILVWYSSVASVVSGVWGGGGSRCPGSARITGLRC